MHRTIIQDRFLLFRSLSSILTTAMVTRVSIAKTSLLRGLFRAFLCINSFFYDRVMAFSSSNGGNNVEKDFLVVSTCPVFEIIYTVEICSTETCLCLHVGLGDL